MRLSGSERIRRITALELALRRSRLSSRKVICAVESRQRAQLLLLDQGRVALAIRPHQILRLAAFDRALTVAQPRFRHRVPTRRGELHGFTRGDLRLACGPRRLGPLAGLALGRTLLVQRQAMLDLRCGEQPSPLLGRLLQRRQGPPQRPVGRGDLGSRHGQLHARMNVGDRGQPVGAQDLGPEIGIAELLLGDITQTLPRLHAHLDRIGGGEATDREEAKQKRPDEEVSRLRLLVPPRLNR